MSKKKPEVEELSPFEAAKLRLLPAEPAARESRFLELDMGDGKPVEVFVLAPKVLDRQVYLRLNAPKEIVRKTDGTIGTKGYGDFSAAKVALMIRCLYFAPEGKDGPLGGRLFEDEALSGLMELPASSWIDEPCNVAESLMEGAAKAKKK